MNLSQNGEQVEETRKLVRVQMELRLLDAAQVVVTSAGLHMKELRLGHLQHQYGAGAGGCHAVVSSYGGRLM
jgi:hypothetical protein